MGDFCPMHKPKKEREIPSDKVGTFGRRFAPRNDDKKRSALDCARADSLNEG